MGTSSPSGVTPRGVWGTVVALLALVPSLVSSSLALPANAGLPPSTGVSDHTLGDPLSFMQALFGVGSPEEAGYDATLASLGSDARSGRMDAPPNPWDLVERSLIQSGADLDAARGRLRELQAHRPDTGPLLESLAAAAGIPVRPGDALAGAEQLHKLPPPLQEATHTLLLATLEAASAQGRAMAAMDPQARQAWAVHLASLAAPGRPNAGPPAGVDTSELVQGAAVLVAAVREALPILESWSFSLSQGPGSGAKGMAGINDADEALGRLLGRADNPEPGRRAVGPMAPVAVDALAASTTLDLLPGPFKGAVTSIARAVLEPPPSGAEGTMAVLQATREAFPDLYAWSLALAHESPSWRQLGTDPLYAARVWESIQGQASTPLRPTDLLRLATDLRGVSLQRPDVAPYADLPAAFQDLYETLGREPAPGALRALEQADQQMSPALRSTLLELLASIMHFQRVLWETGSVLDDREVAFLTSAGPTVGNLIGRGGISAAELQFVETYFRLVDRIDQGRTLGAALHLLETIEAGKARLTYPGDGSLSQVQWFEQPEPRKGWFDRFLDVIAPIFPPSASAQSDVPVACPPFPLSDPGNDVCFADPEGLVVIGGPGTTVYDTRPAFNGGQNLLTIDLGGDDYYTGTAGGTGPTGPQNVRLPSLAIDLAGHDLYESFVPCVQGCAARTSFGILYDGAGDDVYRAATQAQGFVQPLGTGYAFAMLWDDSGNNVHELEEAGLAVVSDFGLALVYDGPGNDVISVERGAALGVAGLAGTAIYVNQGGSDEYAVAGGFGAGVNLLGIGLFLDLGGQDVYPSDSGTTGLALGTATNNAVPVYAFRQRRDDSVWRNGPGLPDPASTNLQTLTNLAQGNWYGWGADLSSDGRDTDRDRFPDFLENSLGSDPENPDSVPGFSLSDVDADGDGYATLVESIAGTSPTNGGERPAGAPARPDALPPVVPYPPPPVGLADAPLLGTLGPFKVPPPSDKIVDIPGILAVGETLGALFGHDYQVAIGMGGADTWTGNAGGTAQFSRPFLTQGGLPAFAMDLGGDDTYLAPGRDNAQGGAGGSAAPTYGVLIDVAGDDTYEARSASQGAADGSGAARNVGLLLDLAGDDSYSAKSRSQGFVGPQGGVGILMDLSGHDDYEADRQAFTDARAAKPFVTTLDPLTNPQKESYTADLALLFDREGDDDYRYQFPPARTLPRPLFPAGLASAYFVDTQGADAYAADGGLAPEDRNDRTDVAFAGFGHGVFVDGEFTADTADTGRPAIVDTLAGTRRDADHEFVSLPSPNPLGLAVDVPSALGSGIGLLAIGSNADSVIDGSYLLTIDLGGNDRYTGNAGGTLILGSAEGRPSADASATVALPIALPVALAIDLGAGADTYETSALGAQGAGILGIGILVDAGGSDSYRSGPVAQGAALGGLGILLDLGASADRYLAINHSQGAAFAGGLGLLVDEGGSDRYQVAQGGLASAQQAAPMPNTAATLTAALLLDLGGDDRYSAGSNALAYASGVNTTALLWDASGHDRAWAVNTSIASATAQGRAAFVDLNGADLYRVDARGLGAATPGSSALFLDAAGKDAYVAARESLGWAQTGATSDPEVSLFLDSGEQDVYSYPPVLVGNAREWNQPATSTATGATAAAGRDLESLNSTTLDPACQSSAGPACLLEVAVSVRHADGSVMDPADPVTGPFEIHVATTWNGQPNAILDEHFIERILAARVLPSGDAVVARSGPIPGGTTILPANPADWPNGVEVLLVQAYVYAAGEATATPAAREYLLPRVVRHPVRIGSILGEEWMGLAGGDPIVGPAIRFGLANEDAHAYQVWVNDEPLNPGLLRTTGWHELEFVDDGDEVTVRLDGAGVVTTPSLDKWRAVAGTRTRVSGGGLLFDEVEVANATATLFRSDFDAAGFSGVTTWPVDGTRTCFRALRDWTLHLGSPTTPCVFKETTPSGGSALRIDQPLGDGSIVAASNQTWAAATLRFVFYDELIDLGEPATISPTPLAGYPNRVAFRFEALDTGTVTATAVGPNGSQFVPPLAAGGQPLALPATVAPGRHNWTWNGTLPSGDPAQSGEYIVRLSPADEGLSYSLETTVRIDSDPPSTMLIVPAAVSTTTVPSVLAHDGTLDEGTAHIMWCVDAGALGCGPGNESRWTDQVTAVEPNPPGTLPIPVPVAPWDDRTRSYFLAIGVDAEGNVEGDCAGSTPATITQAFTCDLALEWPAAGGPPGSGPGRLVSTVLDLTGPMLGDLAILGGRGSADEILVNASSPILFDLTATPAVAPNPISAAALRLFDLADLTAPPIPHDLAPGQCVPPSAGHWCLAWPGGLEDPEGTYALQAVAVAASGKTQQNTSAVRVILDRTPPTILGLLVELPGGDDVAARNDTVRVSFRALDRANDEPAALERPPALNTSLVSANGTIEFTFDPVNRKYHAEFALDNPNLTNGRYRLNLSVIDAAGNLASIPLALDVVDIATPVDPDSVQVVRTATQIQIRFRTLTADPVQAAIEYGTHADLLDQAEPAAHDPDASDYGATLRDLEPGATYYLRIRVTNLQGITHRSIPLNVTLPVGMDVSWVEPKPPGLLAGNVSFHFQATSTAPGSLTYQLLAGRDSGKVWEVMASGLINEPPPGVPQAFSVPVDTRLLVAGKDLPVRLRIERAAVTAEIELVDANHSSFLIDNAAPTFAGARPRPGGTVSDPFAPITIGVLDDPAGVLLGSVRVSRNGVPLSVTCQGDVCSARPDQPLNSSGPVEVQVIASDRAGNEGTASWSYFLRLEDVGLPPEVPAGLLLSSADGTDWFRPDSTGEIRLPAHLVGEDIGRVEFRIPTLGVTDWRPLEQLDAWLRADLQVPSNASDGSHPIELRATDRFGHVHEASANERLQVDGLPPQILAAQVLQPAEGTIQILVESTEPVQARLVSLGDVARSSPLTELAIGPTPVLAGLPPGSVLEFELTVFDRAGNTASQVIRETLAPSARKPSLVTSVQAIDVGAGRLTLQWEVEGQAKAFDVYRARQGEALRRIATLDQPAFEEGALVDGATYAYAISAVDIRGFRGPLSEPVSIHLPGMPRLGTPTVDPPLGEASRPLRFSVQYVHGDGEMPESVLLHVGRLVVPMTLADPMSWCRTGCQFSAQVILEPTTLGAPAMEFRVEARVAGGVVEARSDPDGGVLVRAAPDGSSDAGSRLPAPHAIVTAAMVGLAALLRPRRRRAG